MIIPNGKLVDSRVTNFNQPDQTVRIDILFGVEYGSPIEKVKKLALSCVNGQKNVLKDNEPSIIFTEMADSALNFKLMFYVDDLSNKWDLHQRVITKLYDTLNKNKIGIPFPQREVWMHQVRR